MDVKVYQKEEVLQPSGAEEVYVPNVIDIIPQIVDGQIVSCDTVEDKDMLEQQCALATIFQKGLDPLAVNEGIRWSECVLGEVSALQLIQDIVNAVASVSSTVLVTFDVIDDNNGNSYLSYKLREVV